MAMNMNGALLSFVKNSTKVFLNYQFKRPPLKKKGNHVLRRHFSEKRSLLG
jgi:hypothetical protein